MTKFARHFLFLLIISALILAVFYFDKFSIIGGDVGYYFDISYLISTGHKFLIDFFDYRVPVFPLLLSIVYKMGLSDFANRYLASIFLYSLYAFTTYFLSLFITKSEKKSAFVAIITFLSISSRQFDSGREIEVPLFYHTLEIISVFILLKAIAVEQKRGSYFRLKHSAPLVVSGALFGLAFIGRQIHIFPPILLLGYLLFNAYKNGPRHAGKQALNLALPFLIGCATSVYLIFKLLSSPGYDFINQARIWLFEVPRLFYLGSHPALNILRKIAATFHTGLAGLRNVYLPLFWLVYVFAIPYFYKNFIAGNNLLRTSLIKIYNENKDAIRLISVALIITITTTMTTGFGGTNHQAPFFTLYALALALLLSQINFKKYGRHPAVLVFLILFILPNVYRFIREERVIYQKSYDQRSDALLPEKIAQSLTQAGVKNDDVIMILGGHPTVTRIVGYEPFLGLVNDTLLYQLPRIYGQQYKEVIYAKMKEVKVAYKLPDYPNLNVLSGPREDTTNSTYVYVENYLKSKFEVVSVVKISEGDDFETKNLYGNFSDRVTIYRRIKK